MIIQTSIESKLKAQLEPAYLNIVNESHQHNVPPNSETHFKVIVVSEVFSALSKVKRQQLVYKTLSEELAGEVHALTMQTFSPDEWEQSPSISSSPECLGGSKSSS